MYKVTKQINGEVVYSTKVTSLVAADEHHWYVGVYTQGLPSMRKINDKVNLNGKYSFVSGEDKMYNTFIEIEELEE